MKHIKSVTRGTNKIALEFLGKNTRGLVEYGDGVFTFSQPIRAEVISPKSIIYVDGSTPNGGGSSWDDSFSDLQYAISKAKRGDEIWIAQGSYKPSETDRTVSFKFPSNISVYGGFKGDEDYKDQRTPEKYKTTLSGAIVAEATNVGNTNIIVDLEDKENILFDGISVAYSYSDGSDPAFRCERCKGIAFNNVTIENNYAANFFAGVVARYGDLTINNSKFLNNESASFYCSLTIFEGRLELHNTLFEGNQAGTGGSGGIAGVYIYNSSIIADKCTFLNNSDASNYGPGMYMRDTVGGNFALVSNTLFKGNSTDFGTFHVANEELGESYLYNCIFDGNSVTNINHGIVDSRTANRLNVINCTFVNNTGGNDMVVESTAQGDHYFDNCISNGNTRSITIEGSVTGEVRIRKCKVSVATVEGTVPAENDVIVGPTTVSVDYIPAAGDTDDAGNNSLIDILDPYASKVDKGLDFYGNRRIKNGTVDLGAVEKQ